MVIIKIYCCLNITIILLLFYAITEDSVEACVSFDANLDPFLNVKWNVSTLYAFNSVVMCILYAVLCMV